MPEKIENSSARDASQKILHTRTRKILYSTGGVTLLMAIIGVVILTSFPNTLIHFVVEPKLKQFVIERLGRRYSLTMKSIALTANKDSLVLTGVRITDNGKADDGSTDSSAVDFGVSNPLDRLSTDTVVIAGLDYWKLIEQKGLFSSTISIRSPNIYLRPGSLPKFVKNTGLLPSFLPAVSSKIIKIENARVYFSEGKPSYQSADYSDGKSGLAKNIGGLLIEKASLEFRDFYLDEPTYHKSIGTFFCKGASFRAEEISHVDSSGATDMSVTSVDGDLIDSSLDVYSAEARHPIEEIHRTKIGQMSLRGFDWYSALAGRGLRARKATIVNPHIEVQDVAQIRQINTSSRHVVASDLIPLPSLLSSIELNSVEVVNAEVFALLPLAHSISALKRITMSLNHFRIDSSTPFANMSNFFSRDVSYGISGETSINTSLGVLKFGRMDGSTRSVKVSDVTMAPTTPELRMILLGYAEVKDLDIWKLLMREGFFASSLVLSKPKVYLNDNATSPVGCFDSALAINPLDIFRKVRNYPLPLLLPVASIGAVSVTSGSLHSLHFLDDPANPMGRGDSIINVQLSLGSFRLDKDSWIRKRGMLFSNNASFKLGPITTQSNGASYKYSISAVRGDLGKHTLTMDSVAVFPLIPEDSFGSAFKYRTERLDFLAPRLSISGINYQKLLVGEGLNVEKVQLTNWVFHIYGDRRRSEEPRTWKEKYPQEYFQQIKMPLNVKSILASDGNMSFRESWRDTSEPGTIIMNHVNAKIGPLSNDTTFGGRFKVTPIEGSLKIMNAALINFNLGYQLLNPNLELTILGTAGGMDAALFNSYLAKSEPFILKGVVRSAEFNIELTDSTMTGRLVPQYDSLIVKFFRWDKFPPGFFSFLANTFFMRSHNIPELDHPLSEGIISSKINRNASLFWAIWLPIRSAIGSVVRIPEWVW